MTRPRVNPWDIPANVDVSFPDSEVPSRSQVRVMWESDGALVTAYLESVGGAVEVVGFEVTGGPNGIPAPLRRLPSDLQVLQAARRFGTSGLMAVAFLGDDRELLAEIANRHNISGDDLSGSPAAMHDYARQLAKRPKAKIQREVAMATELLNGINGSPPLRSRQVVDHLISVGGLSEQTAWRRLRAAREQSEKAED